MTAGLCEAATVTGVRVLLLVAAHFADVVGVEVVVDFETRVAFVLFGFESSSSEASVALRLRDGFGEADESLDGDTFRFNT